MTIILVFLWYNYEDTERLRKWGVTRPFKVLPIFTKWNPKIFTFVEKVKYGFTS